MPRTYSSPESFKQALEQRLRSTAETGILFARERQLLVFDRFLARIAATLGDAAVLKGGLVLELRLERARTTKDVDLRLLGSPDDILLRLREACRQDLGDFMTFEVEPDHHHPEIVNEGMLYEGLRFRAECRLAGKLYGQPFGVDVAFGDPIISEPEVVKAKDTLEFAGIAPPELRLYPIESHIAEKLHAYTMPRTRPNSRVKDLPDIALLATVRDIDGATLRSAIDQTFNHRATHPVPKSTASPPDAWAPIYERLAEDDRLRWRTLAEVSNAVCAFLDPVLKGTKALWVVDDWAWRLS